MGEAKNRQKSDPFYGKVPKERPQLGLIISPPMTIEGESIYIQNSDLDPQMLRAWLLFWDKLSWPQNRAIHIESSSDVDHLVELGVLSRPSFEIWGQGADILTKSYVQDLRNRENEEPGCWSLAQGEGTLKIIGKEIPDSRDILVQLHNAIPVPAGDVPFEEILDFKQRRLPELYRLRHEISEMYASIGSNPDKAFALRMGVDKIQTACADLIKVSREWRYDSTLSSWSYSISPVQWFSGVSSFLTSQSQGLDAITSLLTGTVAAGISYVPSIGKKIVAQRNSPYRYAVLAHKEIKI